MKKWVSISTLIILFCTLIVFCKSKCSLPITLTIDNEKADKEIAIRTSFNASKDLVQFITLGGGNSVVNPRGGTLIDDKEVSPYATGFVLSQPNDDACPFYFNGGYIGANHGYDRVRRLVLNKHGKTYADICSEWLDEADNKWYIIKIIDENNLWVLGEDLAENEFYNCVPSIEGTTLTHSQGAVNTEEIKDFEVINDQLTPIVCHENKKILLNGFIEVSSGGTYSAKYIDIIEEYNIINPSSIVAYLQENMPTGGYTDNPALNVGSVVAKVKNIYRFLSDGTMLVITDFTNLIQINMGYIGIIQNMIPSEKILRYIPKAKSVTVGKNTYEFRIPRDMALPMSDAVNLTSEYWEVPNSPPDRLIDFYKDVSGVSKIGFVVGYLPTEDNMASRNVNNAWFLYTTKKSYPHFVDNSLQNPLQAGTTIRGMAYRKFYDIPSDNSNRISMYTVPFEDRIYLYIDYQGETNDEFFLPSDCIGKAWAVIEKSDNITVCDSAIKNRLRIEVTAAEPDYGYCVLELK